MLVLGRKVGEYVQVGDDIQVHVVDVRGGNVRIGIAAPKDVQITRPELESGPGSSDKTDS
ncbi:MAG: carbon storage regulator [Caulobacteraceae bacterium]|nr:carbon storage regulator [Caulobacteraceae bacterium]